MWIDYLLAIIICIFMKKNNELTLFSDLHTHQISHEKDVQSILNLHLDENQEHLILQDKIIYSSGIHPWETKDELECIKKINILKELVKEKKLSAIGECGLDKLKGDFDLQKKFFRKQALMSEEYNLPLIIHCVKSYNELIEIRKTIKPKNKWVIHGFNKKKGLAQQLIKQGFYLSFGMALLRREDLSETFKNLPLDKLFLESDDSQISIRELYFKCSLILNKDIEEVKQIFSLKKLFE